MSSGLTINVQTNIDSNVGDMVKPPNTRSENTPTPDDDKTEEPTTDTGQE